MELILLDLRKMTEYVDQIPDDLANYMKEIKALEGTAYKVKNFEAPTLTYRCAVLKKLDGWYGKCQCPEFTQAPMYDEGKKPCLCIVASLLLQEDYDPDESLVHALTGSPGADPVPDPPPKPKKPKKPRKLPKAPPADIVPPEHEEGLVSSSLVVASGATHNAVLVRPVATIAEAAASFQAFENAKKSLLTKEDVQAAGKKNFIKKSGWRKIAVLFGLTLIKIDQRDFVSEAGHRICMVVYRAVAPGGQFQDGTGYCSFDEAAAKAREKTVGGAVKNEHDVRATAETRAKNRAISDLVGGGEVSAEEMAALK